MDAVDVIFGAGAVVRGGLVRRLVRRYRARLEFDRWNKKQVKARELGRRRRGA